MATPAQLRDAAALLRAGAPGKAAAACQEILRANAEDPAALHLLGVALTQAGQPGEALPALARAVALIPDSTAAHLALGNAHRALQDLPAARRAYEEVLARDASHETARFLLGETLHAAGDLAGAMPHFGRIARANPSAFDAMQRFVDCVAAAPEGPRAVAATPARDRLGPVTVGMCTVNAQLAERARASLVRALAPAALTFDVIRDPRSLAEAFNGILDRAVGDIVILCHDDMEVLDASIHDALADALQAADVVGVVGAERISGPAVLWAGHPWLHGGIAYPRDGGRIDATLYSLRRGIVPGLAALDGVFVVVGPRARSLRFDAATFDGFHFYDLDFTWRAHRDGLRLAVATGIRLAHLSEGAFDASWRRYAERFLSRHPQFASEPAGPHHAYAASFGSAAGVLDFHARLDRAVASLEETA